jgi:hypothetical protein
MAIPMIAPRDKVGEEATAGAASCLLTKRIALFIAAI